jgi:diguanylate cyclase (GGDEF)-like protein
MQPASNASGYEAGTEEPDVVISINELTSLRNQLEILQHENRLLHEKLNAALDGTGLCLWQGMIPTGELTVFNLQHFEHGQMAPHFDVWRSKLHPADAQGALDSYQGHLNGKYPFYEAEYRTIAADGSVTWLWDRGRIMERDTAGLPLRIMGAHVDITQRKEFEIRLAQQVKTEPLTGLFNRQAFSEASRRRMAVVDGAAALLFIDLDDFKEVNDSLGHSCGDRLLLRVADWLRQATPPGGLPARMGGDEFVIYLDADVSEPAIARLAQQLLAHTVACQELDGQPIQIGMSIGIALWHGNSVSYEQALDCADRAMYQAKQRGKRGFELIQLS